MSRLVAVILTTVIIQLIAPTAFAQSPAPDKKTVSKSSKPGADPTQTNESKSKGADADTPPQSAARSRRPRSVGEYPSVPFFRGDSPRNSAEMGFYLNLWCLGIAFAFVGFWVWSVGWANADSPLWSMDREFWNTLLFFGGMGGILSLLAIPNFELGLVFMLALYAAPFASYIVKRNRRAPEASRVMTPLHFQILITRALLRSGASVGTPEMRQAAAGPPIALLTKTRASSGAGKETHSHDVESSPAYMAAKELIYDAILRRVSDVHLEPTVDEVLARYRIDGIMYQAESFNPLIGHALINVFKILAAMDITERRRPQDGSFRAECEGREIDFRVATQGTSNGEKMSLRLLDKSNSVNNLSELGLRRNLQGQIRSVVEQPHGLFLSCGPTGAGKSTTLRAALAELDPLTQNIITVEDPVEYKLESITQIEINTKAGQTFAGSLRSVLRQDPDVIMIGEIRDGETATIACQAANTGHMVFSTVHANDTITALHRLIELGAEPFVVANSISAILGQRLARRLCADCKEPYQPAPELLREHRIPSGKVNKFYRPPTHPAETCTTCGGLGYRGRVGIFELLVVNDAIRELIRGDLSVSAIKAAARKEGLMTMKEEGLRLVLQGTTTIDELLRVVK